MEETAGSWRPIGTVLVEQGLITDADLEAALAEQRQNGLRLGEILIASGRITWLALANAIAEQAKDLDSPTAPPARAAAAVLEGLDAEPEPAPAPAPAAEELVLPPVGGGSNFTPADFEPGSRLQTVEAMLMDRQRAFLELVQTTESLRRTVSRLRDELADREAEITRLRSQGHASTAAR